MKKRIALLLICSIVFSMLPLTASAAEVIDSGICGDNLTWVLTDDGTLTISGTGDMYDYEAWESPWYPYAERITNAQIGEKVTSIGAYAFIGCDGLTDVPIPDSVISVGEFAFWGSGLIEARLGKGVSDIGEAAFRSCDSLAAFRVDAENEYYSNDDRGVLFDKEKQWLVQAPALITGDYEIPNTVGSIDRNAFFNCVGLTGVTIPAGVSWIGSWAFDSCYNLSEIRFRGNAPELLEDVFYDVTATAYYPAGNATWTEDVLQSYGGSITWKPCEMVLKEMDRGECGDNLTWTLMEDGKLIISGTGEMYDFEKSPWDAYAYLITAVDIGEQVTSIGSNAFYNCAGLLSVTIPASVASIGRDAFYWCSELSAIYVDAENPVYSNDDFGVLYDKNKKTLIQAPGKLTGHYMIPESVTSIGFRAFAYCSITGVTIPDTVVLMGDRAFEGCYQLTEIVIFEGITAIGEAAFMSCYSMNSVRIPDSVTSIGDYAFWGCSEPYNIEIGEGDSVVIGPGSGNMEAPSGEEGLKEVYIGKGVVSLGTKVFADCQQLNAIHVDPENAYYCNDDRGVLYNKQKTELIQVPGAVSGHFTIPNTVTAIGNWAMSVCPDLTSVTVPAGVTRIGDYAFSAHAELYFGYETNLEEITFCGNAPEIGYHAFWDIDATVYYPADNPTWTKAVMQDYGGSITWIPYEVEERNYVKWYSGTTSLNGTIDLNIYVLLSDDLVNADDTFVRFTYAGKTVDVPMADALYSPLDTAPNRYRFSCPIYAKQLTDAVNVKFMKGDAVIGSELNYSVVTYCKNRIKNSKDPAEVAICKAMLNYGAASQQLFNYNTDNLANASLSDADKVLKDVNASAYAYSVSGSETGIKAKSATLMLEDVVKVRVYFTLTGNKSIDDYIFTIDGKVVTPSYNDKGWYVETDGIAAKDLEKMFQVKVGGITVTYGALSFVNSKVGGSNALESNISKALYAYWQAAEALLG